jgi:hypothetical protein
MIVSGKQRHIDMAHCRATILHAGTLVTSVKPSRLMEQPSMGMAIKWQMKTVKPMAKGASTCSQVRHRSEPLMQITSVGG